MEFWEGGSWARSPGLEECPLEETWGVWYVANVRQVLQGEEIEIWEIVFKLEICSLTVGRKFLGGCPEGAHEGLLSRSRTLEEPFPPGNWEYIFKDDCWTGMIVQLRIPLGDVNKHLSP